MKFLLGFIGWAASWLVWAQADEKIVTGPWLQAATENSMAILWEGNREVSGKIEFGVTEKLGKSRVDVQPRVMPAAETGGKFEDDEAIIFEIELTDLKPDTVYFYRVSVGGDTSKIFRFRTLKKKGPFTFLTISNTHGFQMRAERLKWEIAREIPVDFVLNQGDQTQQSLNREYRQQLQGCGKHAAETPWFTTRGNHENRSWSRYPAWYRNEFSGHLEESFYSFDVGDMHFVVLNETATEGTFPREWFEADLSKSTKKWKVVVAKKLPHLFGKHFQYELFQKADVDVVLAADCGTRKGRWPQPYEGDNAKFKGVWYLTSCGGYQIVRAQADFWDVESFSPDGSLKEKTRVTPRVE